MTRGNETYRFLATIGDWPSLNNAEVMGIVTIVMVLTFVIGAFAIVAVLVRHEWRTNATLQLAVVAFAAAAGLQAVREYSRMNNFTVTIALEDRDQQARSVYVMGNYLADWRHEGSDDGAKSARPWQGKDMIRIFTEVPYDIDTERCTPSTKAALHTWAVRYFNTAARVSITWTTIDELYDNLWSSENMLDERLDLARAMVMHAIDYLYIVHDAYLAKRSGHFSESEYAMWRAYLDDLGQSPFFLLAIADGEKFAYMMPEVGEEFRGYFRSQPALKCVADSLYPSLLGSDTVKQPSTSF